MFNPEVTVDEHFAPSHEKCTFWQYMPSKSGNTTFCDVMQKLAMNRTVEDAEKENQ